MGRKLNRLYKKGAPHRDSRKFVIVAEGEREDEYFRHFNNLNKRIQIEIVPRVGGKSAAKFLLERAANYVEKSGLEPEDLLWFVFDVDCWPKDEIVNLKKHCDSEKNWSIAISNPCFEVWLYYHFGDASKLDVKKSQQIKTKLNTLIFGGYNSEMYAKEIEKASQNAKKADKNPKHYFPEPLNTKVYLLGEEILKFLKKGHSI